MKILDELKFYCEEPEPAGAILLTGEWGSGKTYFIEHTFEKNVMSNLSPKGILIKVSLFGLNSKEQVDHILKQQWLMACYKEKNIVKVMDNIKPIEDITSKILDMLNTTDNIKGKLITPLKMVSTAVKSIAATDFLQYINISTYLCGKKVILVFDDLERCNMSNLDILGIINDYCENQKFHTIIVANEEKIMQRFHENEDKSEASKMLNYKEIKEKIIQRTIKYVPEYSDLVKDIINSINFKDGYQGFLQNHESDILQSLGKKPVHADFSQDNAVSQNMRSLKCALNNFFKVYQYVNPDHKPEDKLTAGMLYSFILFEMAYKSSKNQENISDDEIQEIFPSYDKNYMFESIKKWLLYGEWNEKDVNHDINFWKESEKAVTPVDIIKTHRILEIEDNILERGFSQFLDMAYEGNLTLDQYLLMLENMYDAERLQLDLPKEIDWNAVKEGVSKCLDTIIRELPENFSIRTILDKKVPSDYIGIQQEIYKLISDFIHNGTIIKEENKKYYIINMNNMLEENDDNNSFKFILVRGISSFDEEMANTAVKTFLQINNKKKETFIIDFKSLIIQFKMNNKANQEEAKNSLEKMISLIKQEKDKTEKTTIRKIHLNKMLETLDKLLGRF